MFMKHIARVSIMRFSVGLHSLYIKTRTCKYTFMFVTLFMNNDVADTKIVSMILLLNDGAIVCNNVCDGRLKRESNYALQSLFVQLQLQ